MSFIIFDMFATINKMKIKKTVQFGAEAPSGHVTQAWAIPPFFWGLLSRGRRQQANEASSAQTQRHTYITTWEIFTLLYDNKWRYFMKRVPDGRDFQNLGAMTEKSLLPRDVRTYILLRIYICDE